MSPEEECPSPPPLPPAGNSQPDHPWHSALVQLGLQPDPKGLAGLNYEGVIQGHPVRVHCSRRTRTKYHGADGPRTRQYVGHRLEIDVETTVKTRVTIFGPLTSLGRLAARSNKWVGSKPVELPGLFPPKYSSWASEIEWVTRFFAGDQVSVELSKLLPSEDIPPNIGVKWWPGHVTFSQRIGVDRITPDTLIQWISSVVSLAALAESDPPSREVELTRWEKFSSKNPVGAGCLFFGCLFATVIIISVIGVGFLMLLAFLFSRNG